MSLTLVPCTDVFYGYFYGRNVMAVNFTVVMLWL